MAFSCFAGILLLENFRGYTGPFHILNIYAPYKDHFPFCDRFLSSEFFDIDSLIIGGDFNCTLSNDEVWGKGRKNDQVGFTLREAILFHNFVDVLPSRREPTWDNGRLNEAYLAKRWIVFSYMIVCLIVWESLQL